jgi:hypothetical protein
VDIGSFALKSKTFSHARSFFLFTVLSSQSDQSVLTYCSERAHQIEISNSSSDCGPVVRSSARERREGRRDRKKSETKSSSRKEEKEEEEKDRRRRRRRRNNN